MSGGYTASRPRSESSARSAGEARAMSSLIACAGAVGLIAAAYPVASARRRPSDSVEGLAARILDLNASPQRLRLRQPRSAVASATRPELAGTSDRGQRIARHPGVAPAGPVERRRRHPESGTPRVDAIAAAD